MASRLPGISEDSEFSVTLSEAAERAERVHEELEEALRWDENPVTRLGRQLSHRSVISTASSFAQQQEEAAYQVDLQIFQFLDCGFCGDVFAYTGKNQVIKRAINNDGQLWHDYLTGLDVHTKFSISQDLFTPFESPRIPKPQCCINPKNERWWRENGAKFPEDRQTEERMPVMILERILPLTKPIRDTIIDVFHGPKGKEEAKASPGNRNCIARLLLGRRRRSDRPPAFFRLKNFSLHLDQAEKIGLDIDTYAVEMAIALAVCHWKVHVDANDVEFVLGSAPTKLNFPALATAQVAALPPYTDTDPETSYDNYKKRSTHLWMLDYDKCKKMAADEEGVRQAVKAAEDNEVYYPKPHKKRESDQKLWKHFKGSYLWASSRIMQADEATTEEMKSLPIKFVEGWEIYRREKLDARPEDD